MNTQEFTCIDCGTRFLSARGGRQALRCEQCNVVIVRQRKHKYYAKNKERLRELQRAAYYARKNDYNTVIDPDAHPAAQAKLREFLVELRQKKLTQGAAK